MIRDSTAQSQSLPCSAKYSQICLFSVGQGPGGNELGGGETEGHPTWTSLGQQVSLGNRPQTRLNTTTTVNL